jgi:hypothetical protein
MATCSPTATATGRRTVAFLGRPDDREQADNYTLEHIFGPVDFWDSTTQPEASGTVYESQGDPWNPIAQIALLPTQPGEASQALNISTRLGVETGDNVLIAGFILTGTKPTNVLLRALGPSFRNPISTMRSPILSWIFAVRMVPHRFNNNWKYAQEAEITATGIPPLNDHEAAILATLSPDARPL